MDFFAGADGGGGHGVGVIGTDAVFVVGHDEDDVVANVEDGGHAVGGVDAGAADFGFEVFSGLDVPVKVALVKGDVGLHLGDVLDCGEGVHGEGLAETFAGGIVAHVAEVPCATGEGTEDAIAGAVDKDGRAPGFAAAA